MENWKDIAGYEGQYQVSDQGRVRSLDRWVEHPIPAAGGYMRKGKMIYIKNDGSRANKHLWSRVMLCSEGKQKFFSLSTIVYETFKGPIDDNEFIHHLDGNPLNNNIDNLVPLLRSESMIRMREIHGYVGKRKLSMGKVSEYRNRHSSGETVKNIIEDSGLAQSSFYYMLRKKHYKRGE